MDFHRMIDRRAQGSAKWEMARAANGGKLDDRILALSTADMDFPVAPEIAKALHEAVEDIVPGYTLPTDRYFDAVISWMARRHDWTVEKDWIVGSPGIVSALYYLLHGFTKPGDGVIIQSPVYHPFADSIRITGRKILDNQLLYENGVYRMDFDDLERQAASPGTKMMFLCSPHNPVGRCWTRDELERVAEITARHEILVVADEIHFDFVFPPHRHTVFASLPDKWTKNIVVCTSPSKSFNIAGLQVSNIVIPDPGIRKQYRDTAFSCGSMLLNVFAFPACIAAYEKSEDWLDALLAHLAENDGVIRKRLAEELPSKIAIPPLEATYLQWLDCSALKLTPLERQKRLHEAGLFFESGLVFGAGGDDFERFNIACNRETIDEALARLARLFG